MFDPQGLASPANIKGKIGLQKLTITKADWYETIEEQEQRWWIRWLEKLEELKELKIPRCIRPETGEDVESEVDVFCDASEEAFAAVAYLRSVRKEKHLFSNIIMAKTRVAPKKTISVAKLELQAALLGARMAKILVKELTIPIRRRRFWTDSSCVRNWLRTTASYYKPFVSHRIGLIQTLTESGDWRFVPGTQNPANWATRSTLTGDLMISPDWIEGPKFFKLAEQEWPKDLPWMKENTEIRAANESQPVNNIQIKESRHWGEIKFNHQDFPSYTKLTGKLLNKVKECQEEQFGRELNELRNGRELKSSSSLLGQTPFLDERGLLRVGGRITYADLPYDNKHPVILPSKHPLSNEILNFHWKHSHMGTDMVLSQLRQHYWIIRGREAVKSVGRRCAICIRERIKPSHQQMAGMPKERLAVYKHPFSHTAVDYFGPMEVVLSINRTDKRYGALFSCLTTRAVYLDLAPSFSSEDFLNVFRRFIATYGTPETIRSENGRNFVGAEKELMVQMKIMQNSGELQDWNQRKGITWKFQPPSAPHFVGANESLVRSPKLALNRALELEKKGMRYPTEEMLRTLLFEVAGLLNSRPLTTSSDHEDLRSLNQTIY